MPRDAESKYALNRRDFLLQSLGKYSMHNFHRFSIAIIIIIYAK